MLPLGDPLSDHQLTLRTSLPLKPAPVTLQGRYVRLEPLDADRDLATLYSISTGEAITLPGLEYPAFDAELLIWRYLFAGPFATRGDFGEYVRRQVDAANGRLFTVFEQETSLPVGMINAMSNSPADLKIELGGIWYAPPVQRTPVNTETTFLLLRHYFDLGYRRLEWKCNALNERSRRAALRMGFQFEGIQESHMIVKDRSRDTAWFRILDREWPAVQSNFERLLYGHC